MRRIYVVLFAFALAVTVGSMTALAQTSVSLSANSTNTVTITPLASPCSDCSLSVTFSVPFSSGNSAAGHGALYGQDGYYSLSGTVTLTWNGTYYSAASTPINFSIYTNSNGTGPDLLSGTLTLVDLQHVGGKGDTNIFSVGDMKITGGSWASSFPGNNGIATFYIALGTVNLGTLGSTLNTKLTTDNSLDPVPEPASIMLFGSGLLALGAMLRRRSLATGAL